MKPIKILYYIDGLRNGGKERQLMVLLKALANNNDYKLAIIIMNKDVYFKEVFDLDIDVNFIVRNSRFDLSVFSKFNKFCKNFNPDIIHSWDSLTSTYAIPTVLFRRIKFINGSIRHSARPRFLSKFWWITHLTYTFSHRVVSNSRAGLFAHNKNPDNKYRCIVNGFNADRINELKSEKEIREHFNIKTSRVIGMVANFEDRKDYSSFIEVAEQILKKRNDVSFIAIGEGKNFLLIKEMIHEKYCKHILLLGRQMDVESIINVFDIGLLINNIHGHGEGISNSIMEYMALGKPVIATDSGGNKEIVLNKKTGFIIEPFNVELLVRHIDILLENKKKAKEMGRLGKMRIKNEFSLKKMKENYINLYNELMMGM